MLTIGLTHAQGFSLYTDLDIVGGDAVTGKVVNQRVTHVGLTSSPAWAKEGSMVHEFSDQPFMMRQVIRDKYLTRPGAHFSEDTRRRLAETEAADRLEIETRRAARTGAPSRLHSHFATMAAVVPATPPTPLEPATPATPAPPVDPMVLVTPHPVAPPPALVQQEKTPREVVDAWKAEKERISRIPEYHTRWEELTKFKDQIESTWSNQKLGAFALITAGADKVFSAVQDELRVLRDVPVKYIDEQLRTQAMSSDRYIATKAALLMETFPTGKSDDMLTAEQLRVICSPVRAAALGEAKSQKDVEMAREALAAEKARAETAEKRENDMKRKYADMEKEMEGYKKSAQAFKDVTPAKLVESLAKTPEPAAAGTAADAASSSAAVSAADLSGKGEWGVHQFVKQYADTIYARNRGGDMPDIGRSITTEKHMVMMAEKADRGQMRFGFAYKDPELWGKD